MEAAGIDWETILDILPNDGNDCDEQRNEMWFLFNVNENPGLTVFELEKGIVEMTQSGDLFDSENAINLAFEYAQNTKDPEKGMENLVDRGQFRLFIRILKMIFEFYQAFNWIDSDGDHEINKTEFTSEPVQQAIEKLLGTDCQSASQFDSIKEDGEEKLSFQDFLKWACKKNDEFKGSKA